MYTGEALFALAFVAFIVGFTLGGGITGFFKD